MSELKLPNTVAVAAKSLPQEARATLLNKYQAQAKSKGVNWLCWIFCVQFIYQRKYGLAIVYLASLCFMFGLFWMVIEAFQNNKRIDEYNNDLAMELLTEAKLLQD